MISDVRRKVMGQADENDILLELTAMQRNTIAVAEEIRHVSHDLHPGLLQHTGLVPALSVFCEEFEKQQAIDVTYLAGSDLGVVGPETALCLYRITQEALRNVAKHASARHVTVALTRTADGVRLSIADDGTGFDLAGTRGKGDGLGLVSIDERARLLGGRVRIDTQPRKGTRVEVQIPVTRETPAADAAARRVASVEKAEL
jgi:two-component system sensor histidine kinase UhpB